MNAQASSGPNTKPPGAGWPWLAAFLLLAAAGVAVVLWATPLGVGVGYDSFFYLKAAENLNLGHGLGRFSADGIWAPLIHYPPLYPILLAVLAGPLSISISEAGRIAGAALIGINILAVVLLFTWATRKRWLGLIGGLVFLASPLLLEQHLWAMSEPLFFALMLLVVYSLTRYLAENGKLPWLILASLGAALAYLGRYAGLAVLATSGVVVLSMQRIGWRRRITHLAAFGFVAALVGLPWLLRNQTMTGSFTNRTFRLHFISMAQLKQAGSSMAGWLGPAAVPQEIRLVLVSLLLLPMLLLAASWVIRDWGSPQPISREGSLLRVLMVMAVLYPASVLASLTFFDASTRLGDRILSPNFLLLLLITLLFLGRISGRLALWQRLGLGIVMVVLVLAPYLAQSWQLVSSARVQGLGFNSRAWRSSETVAAVRDLPAEALVYSNESFPLSYLTARGAFSVPEKIDPVKASERPDYQAQLGTMRHRLEAASGYLILFHPESLRVEMPSLAEITQGMALQASFEDGRIYRPAGSVKSR